MASEAVVIFVHGAFHGPWAWSEVVDRLDAGGVRTVCVSLPSAGLDTAALGDLHDDAEVVRAAIAAADGPAIVVAHSYAGVPTSEAATGAAHIVFLTAFVLEPGQSLLGLRGGIEPDWWLGSEDGRSILPDNPQHVFYNDCPPAVAERSAAAIVPQSRASFTQELGTAAWQTVPSTYVICERDNAIPPAVQEMLSRRAGTVIRLDSGHSPFLSRPDDVVTIVQTALATLT
jgi:pimeloyl-ACP methyl ester carboxylesterase